LREVVSAVGNQACGVAPEVCNLQLVVLSCVAAKVWRVGNANPWGGRGRSTVSVIKGGFFYVYVGLIERLIRRMKHEFGTEIEPGCQMKVIASGGLAPLFSEAIDEIEEIDSDLTLRGLLHIYHMNI